MEDNINIQIGDIDNYVKEIMNNPLKFAHNVSIIKLVDILRQLSYYYYTTDNNLIPDSIYDLLKEVLEERDPKNKYLQEIGYPIDKEKVNLPFPMPSLNKIKPNINNINDWKKKYIGPYIISDKLDGVSGLLYKNNNRLKLFTRGDSLHGQDITHLIPYLLKNVNINMISNNTAIRGEIIISKNNYKKINNNYKNARSAVIALVNSKNFSINIANITNFIAYELIQPRLKYSDQFAELEKIDFPFVQYKIEKDISSSSLSNYLELRRQKSDYNIDGIVIADNSEVYNIKDKNPLHSFAFKMILTDQIAEAYITNIEWNISMYGYLKPIINIKPVNIGGVTIKNATAFNAKYIVDNQLGPGAIVQIIRSGDVIPYILKVIEKSPYGAQMPSIPYKWNKTDIDIIVQDVHGSAKDIIIIKQITNFFKILGVKYISEGIVTKLVEHGYKSIPSILSAFNTTKLLNIDGIGEKILNKILSNIINVFETTNLVTLMAASNIFKRGLGIKKLKIIVTNYPNIMNENWDYDKFNKKILDLRGFDTLTSTQFVKNFDKFIEFFNSLEKIENINISRLKYYQPKIKNDNIFANMNIVFTGFRNKDWELFIENNKGSITTSVSKKTNLVIYSNDSLNSSKYQKAKDLDIQLISKSDFEKKYIK